MNELLNFPTIPWYNPGAKGMGNGNFRQIAVYLFLCVIF